jgi:3-hydroxy-9,10-secoandrosta-1,3,5(10)-triene-9,17-dione monooxygenase
MPPFPVGRRSACLLGQPGVDNDAGSGATLDPPDLPTDRDNAAPEADVAERLGRLPDDTAKVLKSAGLIKLLQPKGYGGFEAHPKEFAEPVTAVASLDGVAGWICGVLGVRPWQLASADPKVREEVWSADGNT